MLSLRVLLECACIVGCMIDNTVLGLIFYNIWTIKCLISTFIKGLAKLVRNPVTDVARGEFEISVRGGRLNELLPQEKEEGIFLLFISHSNNSNIVSQHLRNSDLQLLYLCQSMDVWVCSGLPQPIEARRG